MMKIMKNKQPLCFILVFSCLLISVHTVPTLHSLFSLKKGDSGDQKSLQKCRIFMKKTNELVDINLASLTEEQFREKLNIFIRIYEDCYSVVNAFDQMEKLNHK